MGRVASLQPCLSRDLCFSLRVLPSSLPEAVFSPPSLPVCFLCDSGLYRTLVDLVGARVPLYVTLNLRDPRLLN